MSLSIQDPLVQTNSVRRRIQQVEVLERFRQPETLHFVDLRRLLDGDVAESRVAEFSRRVLDDGLEHLPAFVLPAAVTRNAIHVPHGFDRFGSGE